jgi:hypothetical protein
MKKVIVVGNAASVLTKKQGRLIDSLDVVVRINKFVTRGYEDHVGTKTNVYCSKWLNMCYNMSNLSSYEQVWLPYPKPPNWWTSKGTFNEVTLQQSLQYAKEFEVNENNIKFLDNKRAAEMENVFKNTCQPSTGLIALMMAIQEFPSAAIKYVGFDSFNTGWYWDPSYNCVKDMKNSIIFEKIFLNYLDKHYGVTGL